MPSGAMPALASYEIIINYKYMRWDGGLVKVGLPTPPIFFPNRPDMAGYVCSYRSPIPPQAERWVRGVAEMIF